MPREPKSATPATRWLDERGVGFTCHTYPYLERGGALHAAECLGLPAHAVIKTLVLRTDQGRRLLVLMHGDRKVSTRQLARELVVRRVHACLPDEALGVTGYVVGGISPFATRETLPVLAEATIFDLPRIWINGGRRGLLLELDSGDLRRTLQPREVAVGR